MQKIVSAAKTIYTWAKIAIVWAAEHKTYIVAVLTAIHAVSGFLCGQADANRTLEELLIAGGLWGLRHGVAKVAGKADRSEGQ